MGQSLTFDRSPRVWIARLATRPPMRRMGRVSRRAEGVRIDFLGDVQGFQFLDLGGCQVGAAVPLTLGHALDGVAVAELVGVAGPYVM